MSLLMSIAIVAATVLMPSTCIAAEVSEYRYLWYEDAKGKGGGTLYNRVLGQWEINHQKTFLI